MYESVRYIPLAAKRCTAGFVAVLLVLAPLAPGLLAISGEPAPMCSLHGKNCTCPDKCAREHGGSHDHGTAHAAPKAPQAPACHRAATGASDSKPDCQMKGCGKEERIAHTVQSPAEPALAAPGLLAPLPLASEAIRWANPLPIEAWLPPLLPPPRF